MLQANATTVESTRRIADELAGCGVKLVASLPDNWIAHLIDTLDGDGRFTHVRVNREESAVGLCAGAYLGGMGAAALMGASGLVTCIYAITKINFTYEVPLLCLATLRGAIGDPVLHHISNGLYLRPLLDALRIVHTVVERPEQLSVVRDAYRHAQAMNRPVVVLLAHSLFRGEGA